MNSKMFLIISVVLIVVGLGYMMLSMNPSGKRTTLTGQFVSMSDCTGVVQGTRITDYGNMESLCDNSEKYDGKVVNITGYVFERECEQGKECFMGPQMEEVEEIEIVE